jgi:hypothetical protein
VCLCAPPASVLLTAAPESLLASVVVNNVALALSIVTTLLSGWYMSRKKQQIKLEVVRERCLRRMREEAARPVRTATVDPSPFGSKASLTTYGPM